MPSSTCLLGRDHISKSRALVVINDDALVSPDVRSRITALQGKKYSTAINTTNLLIWYMSGALGLITLGIIAVIFGLKSISMPLVVVGLAAFAASWFIDQQLKQHTAVANMTSYPCPLCHEQFNLAHLWLCGNCKHENNGGLVSNGTPFSNCADQTCSKPVQSAFQCPKCHHHIVMDKPLYLSERSFETPYRQVARFHGDNHQPLVDINDKPDEQASKFFRD